MGQRMAEGDGRQARALLKKYRELYSQSSRIKRYLVSWFPKLGTGYNRKKKEIINYIEMKKAGL